MVVAASKETAIQERYGTVKLNILKIHNLIFLNWRINEQDLLFNALA